ncbi:MAG: PAS domain S-box protein [Marinilabiliaceae bacterium]|nr:PAS domain S-box protein [Marinilabiliaceae bacterium]
MEHFGKNNEDLEKEVAELKKQLELSQKKDNNNNDFLHFLNKIPDATMFRSVKDLTTGIHKLDFVNETWEKIMGISEDLALEDIENIFVHVIHEDLIKFKRLIDDSHTSVINFIYDFRYINPQTKKKHWLQVNAYTNKDENFVYTNGLIFDITARKETEQQLLTQNERLLAIDQMLDGALYRSVRNVRTGEIRIDYVSKSWEQLMGVSAMDTLADIKNLMINMPVEDREILKKNIYESDDPHNKFNVEVRYNHPVTKKSLWLQFSSYPHRKGNTIYADGFVFDVSARKEAEQKLLIEKERMESLGNNIPDGALFQFYLENLTGLMGFSFVSAKWEEITGVPNEIATSNIDTLFAMVHPDDIMDLMVQVEVSAKSLSKFLHEFRVSVHGQTKWIKMSSLPQLKGNSTIWDGIISDVTQRKESETELENEKKRLQMLGDNLPESALYQFMRNNQTGQMRMSYVSGTWESISGIPAQHTLNDISSVFDAIEPNDLPALIESIEDSAKTMNYHLFETKINGKWINITARPRNEGIYTVWDGIMTDISKRKETEQLLEAEKNRIETLGNNIPQGSLFQFIRDNITRQMRFSYLSKTWEIVTQIDAEVALADITKVFSIFHPDDLQFFLKSINESASNMTDIDIEIRFGIEWMRIIARPRIDSTQIIWDGLIINITDRKKTELEVEQYRENLEQLVQVRTDALNTVNEELNSANEELYANNEELHAINDELHKKNAQIAKEFSARMEIMKRLEESENKMRSFVEQSFEGIVITDNEGNILEWNHEQERISGIPASKALNKKCGEILEQVIHEDNKEVVLAQYQNMIKSFINSEKGDRQSEDFVMMIRAADGLEREVKLTAFTIQLPDKNFMGQIIRDVTEQNIINQELDRYRTQLEEMVEIKTNELKKSQGNLLALNKRQDTLINVLQIMQSIKSLSEALDLTLHEMGKFTGVSRVYIFEKSEDKTTMSNTVEWCNEGVEPVIDSLQNIPVENAQPWWDAFENDEIICTSDINTFSPEIQEVMNAQNIKSIVVLPLTSYGYHYGFVGFDECRFNREWKTEEIELLKNLSQIISSSTRRHNAETSLRQSEDMYRQLTVASPDAIIVCDGNARVKFASTKTFNLFGLAENTKLSNLRLLRFVCQQDRKQSLELFEILKTENFSFLPEIMLQRADNTSFYSDISSTTIKDSEGRNESIIMVIRDITQRKLDELELINAKNKAEESDKLKSAFLANMSHEIRTPLTGIVGFLKFISSDEIPREQRQQYIEIVNNNSRQLTKLVEDIIDIAKIEANQLKINPYPVKLNELMRELKIFYDEHFATRNKGHINLILDESGAIDDCLVFADAVRLRQVLTNLIDNALKFTEDGYIKISYRKSAPEWLEFVVEDSGIGMSPEQLEVIFDRFRQVELGNNRQYGGTGLGLTISRNLVQIQDGQMWVESTEKTGTTFFFTIMYIPIDCDDAQIFDGKYEKKNLEKPYIDRSVILVEPMTMKFKYYDKLISVTGATVTQALSVKQLLEFFNQNIVTDLVIIDIDALEHDDLQNIKQINAVKPDLPLVIITQSDKCTRINIKKIECKTVTAPISFPKMQQILSESLD